MAEDDTIQGFVNFCLISFSVCGTAGCTQSTLSSTWSPRASSEKFTESFLRMSLLGLQPFGDEAAFSERLTHHLLQLSCHHIFSRKDSF